ncbi:MAG: ion channel [Chitinophagales bacterium]
MRERRQSGVDIGLDRQGQKGRQRTINKDGSYNIRRITDGPVNFELFHWLINTTWSHYWMGVAGYYTAVNIIFAGIYYWIGPENINGISATDGVNDFLQCFFFSVQTFTTVGYGGMHPASEAASWVASVEAFLGLMIFAIATGTLYGRFSKPRQKIKYSQNAIVARHADGLALQFMVANNGSSNLMEVEATVNFSWVEMRGEERIRQFKTLPLEISKIAMFPTSWVVNHQIDSDSPLWGWGPDAYVEHDIEVFCMIKAYDETFSGTIYSRASFTAGDVVYGARFKRPFHVSESGQLVMDMRMVGEYDKVELGKIQWQEILPEVSAEG